ncbi:MAG: DUF1924 domain-containing protein [Mariprofundaceae bacterium]|nr:DUF1924 domain-containing protein [Mariprofundaceae bacterium]
MKTVTIILLCMAALPVSASEAVIAQMQSSYRAEGTTGFSAERGESLWRQTQTQQTSGKPVSCTTCHSGNLRDAGSHIRTGKRIEPMAFSMAGADRLNDPEKIEKWFLRNCKWTLGRECTAQEKGDFLSYFLSR